MSGWMVELPHLLPDHGESESPVHTSPPARSSEVRGPVEISPVINFDLMHLPLPGVAKVCATRSSGPTHPHVDQE
eukprot:m.162755 g.162755  ORF g.162755 m.162755 type:complete len:75 (-) comp23885_c0_seq3:885-1109(-)